MREVAGGRLRFRLVPVSGGESVLANAVLVQFLPDKRSVMVLDATTGKNVRACQHQLSVVGFLDSDWIDPHSIAMGWNLVLNGRFDLLPN